jgi:hypothetical protein
LAGAPFCEIWELLFVNLVGTYFSLKGGLGPSKRGQILPNVQYRNVPTKFSFGIGWEDTGKIPTNTKPKYQIGVQLY